MLDRALPAVHAGGQGAVDEPRNGTIVVVGVSTVARVLGDDISVLVACAVC